MKPYEGKEPYLFVSYAHKDSQRVLPVMTALSQKGFRIWYDAGIEAGSEWPAYIEEHLARASAVLIFMSPAANESRYCKREIYCADELKKEIMVVYLENVTPDPGLRFILRPLQAIFRSRFPSDAALAEEIAAAKILQPCRGAMNAASSDDNSMESLLSRAETGDAEAMFRMGDAYYRGIGTEKDPLQALFWFRKAADLGHTEAEYQVANHYQYGIVVANDQKIALQWHQRAAAKGHAGAAYYLAYQYGLGKWLPKDNNASIRWYRISAKGGDRRAMSQLANFYKTGKGLPQDYIQMLYWYQQAAEAGDYFSTQALAECYRDGIGVAVNDEKAMFWYRKALEITPSLGYAAMGEFYEKRGNLPAAIRAYRESMKVGNSFTAKMALRRLGVSETE